jgi:Ca-activated chloride channel family protein
VLSLAVERRSAPDTGLIAVELRFQAPLPAAAAARPPLPLSIGVALDRSGSMSGRPFAAARGAVERLVERMADRDRIAIAAFSTEASTVVESVALDAAARSAIITALAALRAGGNTALFDGHRLAAELVAKASGADTHRCWLALVSDGMGNVGPCDPKALRSHAERLAQCGIRTIAIGVGERYEARQLEALAEGGAGAFHHASEPEEIVEILLGEFEGIYATTVSDLSVGIETAPGRCVHLFGGDIAEPRVDAPTASTRFTRVIGGREARVIALVDASATEIAWTCRWRDADGIERSTRVVARLSDGPIERDEALAERAAGLWLASLVCRASDLNRCGRFEEAVKLVQRESKELLGYLGSLDAATRLREGVGELVERLARPWNDNAGREYRMAAAKSLRSEPEFRKRARYAWIKEVFDELR